MKKRINEDDIVRTAARIFREKGYESTRLQDVADEFGLHRGSLYSYITSKEELLIRVIQPASRLSIQKLETVAKSQMSSREKIERAIENLLQMYVSDYPHFFVFLGQKLNGLSEKYQNEAEIDQKYYKELWQRIIEEGINSGEIRSDIDAKIAYFGILGMCNWMYRWYTLDGRLSIDEIGRTFKKMILDGLSNRKDNSN